jgi:hypothetical protein
MNLFIQVSYPLMILLVSNAELSKTHLFKETWLVTPACKLDIHIHKLRVFIFFKTHYIWEAPIFHKSLYSKKSSLNIFLILSIICYQDI